MEYKKLQAMVGSPLWVNLEEYLREQIQTILDADLTFNPGTLAEIRLYKDRVVNNPPERRCDEDSQRALSEHS